MITFNGMSQKRFIKAQLLDRTFYYMLVVRSLNCAKALRLDMAVIH